MADPHGILPLMYEDDIAIVADSLMPFHVKSTIYKHFVTNGNLQLIWIKQKISFYKWWLH